MLVGSVKRGSEAMVELGLGSWSKAVLTCETAIVKKRTDPSDTGS